MNPEPLQVTIDCPAEMLEQIAQRAADIALQHVACRGFDNRRWLTVDEAADYIGARPQRIYDLRSSGRLSRHGDGTRALVDRAELDSLVQARGSVRRAKR